MMHSVTGMAIRFRQKVVVVALTFAGVLGCASTGSGGGTDRVGRGANSDIIDRSELARSNAQNAYDAVRSLRPAFLASRGATTILLKKEGSSSPVVYLDNTRYGDVTTLRNISLDGIFEIRFFSATQAQMRWGMDHPAGAILVVTALPKGVR